jgi:type VI protein secretion system component VasA
MSDPLPELLDAKHLAAELSITRAAAEKVMQALPIVQVPGLRKTYVRRPDVERLLEACTFSKDQVPAA